MSQDFSVGDTAQIVFLTRCCNSAMRMGYAFIVNRITKDHTGPCSYCKKRITYTALEDARDGRLIRAERCIKLPDPDLSDSRDVREVLRLESPATSKNLTKPEELPFKG